MSSILKISDAATIALHSMIMLANSGDNLTSVKEIASAFDISANHLSKVLQRLVKSGLVESIKGAKGGFKITGKPEDITFLQIYEAIDGKFTESECLLGKHACLKDKCIMSDLVHSINEQVKTYFKDTRLSDFKCF